MDQCEELASEYGVLPREIMHLPWVHFREIWKSFTKRMKRKEHREMAMLGVNIFNRSLGGVTSAENTDDLTEKDIDGWAAKGLPVQIVRK